MTFKMEGLDEFIKALNQLPTELEAELNTALNDCASTTAKAAKAIVPVKTSEVHDSISVGRTRKKKDGSYMYATAYVGKKGVPLELGHRLFSHRKLVGDVDARPFIRPAFDETQATNEKKLESAFKKTMDKTGDKK